MAYWRQRLGTVLLVAAILLALAVLAATRAFDPGRDAGSGPLPAGQTSAGRAGDPPAQQPTPAPEQLREPAPQRTPGADRTAASRSRQARFVFPVGGCPATASRAHHDYPAADIFARVGCRFVAPVDGRIDEVTRTDTWDPKTNVGRDRGGLSVSVVGVDGVRYYGSHLSSVGARIQPGLQVRAGEELGRTGRTGSARNTPAHLHFGISWPTGPGKWWIRRGAIPPQQFLDAWQDGRQGSPAAAVARARTTYGVDRGCRSFC